MDRIARLYAVLIVLLWTGQALSAQEYIGSIAETSGDVQYDAFGSGWFIAARPGDQLTADSVIRADENSRAVVVIDGTEYVVSAESTVTVGNLARTRDQGIGGGVFGRLLRSLRDFVAPPEPTSEGTGRRHEDQSRPEAPPMFTEDDEFYSRAVQAMEDGRYLDALNELHEIFEPGWSTRFTAADYHIALAYCNMQVGRFDEAIESAFTYLDVDAMPESAHRLPAELQVIAGLSAYMLGDEDLSIAAIDSYLEGQTLAQCVPEAIAVKIGLLRRAGMDPDAARLAADARRAQPSVDWTALVGE